MKLSEHLKSWRIERPDEWNMDEFIRKAVELEQSHHAEQATDSCLSGLLDCKRG